VRGKKAKKLREIAYEGTAMKYSRNREYDTVKSPGQWRNKLPRTIIADHQRNLYQLLKGRRPIPDGAYLGEMPFVWQHT
jgi:hypothetical protein